MINRKALKAYKDGKKIKCNMWSDGAYIKRSPTNWVIDESGVSQDNLIQQLFNQPWEICEEQ